MTVIGAYSVTIWLFTMVILSHVTRGADPVYTPQTLSDSAGNFADNTSTITWSDIPSGQPYNTADPSRISGGMEPYYDLVHSFINSVFMYGIPKELIEKGMNSELDDIVSNYTNYITPFIGFATCVGIGVLFMLIFPIIACCFCCCRCCGNCGGKKYQSPEDSANKCKKYTFIIIIMVAATFVFVGTICIYINNSNISTMLDNIPDTSADNIADVKVFVKNTLDEFNHLLVDDFNFLQTAIIRDLDNIGYLVGVPFKKDLDDNTDLSTTLTKAYTLADSVDSMDTALTDVENKKAALETSVNELQTAIVNIQTNIDSTFTTCGVSCPAVNKPDYSSLSVDIDTNQFPDLSDARTSMDDALATNLTQKIVDAEKEFDDIPDRVESDANSTMIDMKNSINDFNDTLADITDQIADINEDINGPSDTYDLIGWQEKINDFTDLAKTYDKYRWYGGVGLSSLCLLVAVFAVFGVLLGFFGTSITTPSTERGCISNCGGIFLMAAAGIILVFSALLMLLTVPTFLLGAPIQEVICEPVTDLEKLEEYITIYNDKQVGAGKYFLGDLIHQNDTIPLTVTGMLNDCKDGKSGFTSFKFDVKYDIDDVFNFTDTLDVKAEIDAVNIDLSTVSIYPASLKTQLDDVNDAVNISFNEFYVELGKNISTVDLSDLADDIDAYAASVPDPAKSGLEAQADELRRVETEEYAYVQGNLTALNTSVAAMDATVSSVPALVTELDTGLQTAQDFVQNNGSTVIKTILSTYADRLLGIVDSFVDYTKDALFTKIGSCEPIWNFYNSVLVYTFCYNAIDGLNGFWFSLGWVIFFFMPTLIFSVKAAKYFRTMKDDDDPPPYSENKNQDAFRNAHSAGRGTPSRAKLWMKKNKVAHRDGDDW